MSAPPEQHEAPRWRTGLRRHGLARRPADLRDALAQRELRFTDGNEVELFDCGRGAFPSMLEAISSAQEFVHLETYTLRADRAGSRFLEALIDRAAAGVDVRLLYDAVGSIQLAATALRPLREAGGDIVVFNPLRRLYPRWGPRRRDHRKLLIVDGSDAFVGGLNIGDEYDAPPVAQSADAGWRDTHARVRGPTVRDLGAVFLESWFRAGGAELPWQTLLAPEAAPAGDVRCAILPDGPVYRRRRMRDLLVSSLDGTASSARLTSPYFAPDGKVLQAMERAGERGVRVELILAGQTDHPLLRRGARVTLERLLRRDVRVYEYFAAMLHAKSAVFDERIGIVGTSNLDRQSLQHSYEVNLIAAGGRVPTELTRLFETDLERCEEVTLGRLAKRSPWTAAIDRVAAWAVKSFL